MFMDLDAEEVIAEDFDGEDFDGEKLLRENFDPLYDYLYEGSLF